MEIFKINFKSHVKAANSMILIVLMSAFFPYLMSILEHQDIASFIWLGILMFVVFATPCFLLHINYTIVNHGDVFKYSYQERKVTILHKGKSTTFNLDEIDSVERFMSFNLAAKRSSVLPWDEYNHSYIQLKNGERFTITSLLVPNLNLPLEEGRIVIKQNFYRWPNL